MKRLAIVGATGLVGQATLKVLKEENLVDKFDIVMIVSERSAGRSVLFDGVQYELKKLEEDIFSMGFDYAIFLTDEKISRVWVPKFAATGAIVIDNSSAFRLHETTPLIVPEININKVRSEDKIIANPNCSTIQLVVVLDKLKQISNIKKVVVSSYQSVSGAGREALEDLQTGTRNYFNVDIRENFIASIGSLGENGNFSEENKIILETKKILEQNFDIFAMAVRVPIAYCHGESVYVELENDVEIAKLQEQLDCEHIKYSGEMFYPSECVGTNLTYVYRLRQVGKNAIMFFVLADNLRRGAAYNAVKILDEIRKR